VKQETCKDNVQRERRSQIALRSAARPQSKDRIKKEKKKRSEKEFLNGDALIRLLSFFLRGSQTSFRHGRSAILLYCDRERIKFEKTWILTGHKQQTKQAPPNKPKPSKFLASRQLGEKKGETTRSAIQLSAHLFRDVVPNNEDSSSRSQSIVMQVTTD